MNTYGIKVSPRQCLDANDATATGWMVFLQEDDVIGPNVNAVRFNNSVEVGERVKKTHPHPAASYVGLDQ